MFWPFVEKTMTRRERDKRELDSEEKVLASQQALLEAATKTADAADNITAKLRQQLDDILRQFDTTSRLISDALIICDENGRIHAFNPAAETMFVTSLAMVEQTSVSSLFHRDGNVIDINDLWQTFDNTGAWSSKHLQGCRRNGEIFPIEASFTRLDRQDGPVLVLLLIRDTTNRHETERLLKEHEHRFQSLFDLSFDAIFILVKSDIVAANRSASALFGMSTEALLAATPEDLFLANGVSVHTGEIAQETTRTRGDGVKLQMLFSSTEITWNAQPAHLVTIKDVSMLHDFSKSISQNTDNGTDMICVMDANFTIKFCNNYFKQYYCCDEPSGINIHELLPPSECETFDLKILSLNPNNHTIRSQVQHVKEDGTCVLLDWIDHAVFDDQDNIIEYQRTGRDITHLFSDYINQV